jgi:hypothetical protein
MSGGWFMKRNRQQHNPKSLKTQLPKSLSTSKEQFRHRDRGIHSGRAIALRAAAKPIAQGNR